MVRYSGTEPLLRVMIESDDASYNDRLMSDMLETISRALVKSQLERRGAWVSRLDRSITMGLYDLRIRVDCLSVPACAKKFRDRSKNSLKIFEIGLDTSLTGSLYLRDVPSDKISCEARWQRTPPSKLRRFF